MLIPTVVMPAIYHFDIPNRPHESKWGWHNASELLLAVNNILAKRGEAEMTEERLKAEFGFIDPMNVEAAHWTQRRPGLAVIEIEGNHLWHATCGEGEWLHTQAAKGRYIPAKIGIALLDAIKNPLKRKVKGLISSKGINAGWIPDR